MPKLIAAHTPANGYNFYPPFINVSHGDDPNTVRVILRGNEIDGQKCGADVAAVFSRGEFALFLLEAAKNISD